MRQAVDFHGSIVVSLTCTIESAGINLQLLCQLTNTI